MQKAIFMAQVALYVFICAPYLSTEIMRLDGPDLPGGGWGLGIGGAVACLVMCEVYKLFVKRQIDAYQAVLLKKEEEQKIERDALYAKMDAEKATNGQADHNGEAKVTVETQRSNGYTQPKEQEVWQETMQV
jgi:hypothetical protein